MNDYDAFADDMLVRGLSAVDATLEHASAIASFEQEYHAVYRWLA